MEKTSPTDRQVLEAVRNLRKALGDTQQSFAQRLGLAISTVVRYESTRPPKGTALAQLIQVARENDLPEIAQLFAEALASELRSFLPPDATKVLVSGLHRTVTVTIAPEQKPDFEALLLMLRNPDVFAKELAQWADIREQVRRKAPQ